MCHCSHQQDYRREQSGLTEVPWDIPDGTKRVFLRYNSIKKLKADTFSHLYQCTYLALDSNAITEIDDSAFRGLIKLDHLSLSINKIQEIGANMFERLPSLTILGLANNLLNAVPYDVFQHLSNLDELWFARNQIAAVMSENFSELHKLQELILRSNNLIVISGDMWIGLESLTYLDLYENKITVIEKGGFANLPMIEHINLMVNKLSTLSPDAFCLSQHIHPTAQPSKLTLLLEDNDMFCNSSLCWLKEAESNGLITLSYLPELDFSPYRVECVNFPDAEWDEVVLDCMDVGECMSMSLNIKTPFHNLQKINFKECSSKITVECCC